MELNVKVSRAGPGGQESHVRVNRELTAASLKGFTLKSSNVKVPIVDHACLPEGLGWAIDDRARHTGQRKGRILAVWQGDTLVAACSWHLHESGPPVIFDLGCRFDLDPKVATRCETVLMICLRRIAAHPDIRRNQNCLRWADLPFDRYPKADRARVRGIVRRRAEALGFTKLKKRPKRLRGKWATERSF